MSLASLGVSARQERVYRYFLRNPGTDPATASAELGLPDLPAVLTELREMELIDARLGFVTPAVAVDLLVRRRVEQTQRQLTELTAAWDVLAELSEEHRSGRAVQMVEHIPNGVSVVRRFESLLSVRNEEFAYLRPWARSPTGEGTPPHFRRCLAAGLKSRTLFSAEALADPAQEPVARELTALGDHHRVTDEPVRNMAIVNRSVAFVQADPETPEAGALEIRAPGVVTMLREVFEGMWTRGRELDELPLSPFESRVLDALTRHSTDEAAARSLHVSVRKFRTHVAELMDRLGARTRFQAALLAKERGWM